MLKKEFRYYCKDRYLKNLPRNQFEKYFTKLVAPHKYCINKSKESSKPHLDFTFDGPPNIITPWSRHPQHNLPTLMKKMHSKSHLVACQAISALCNLMHDPERAMQALKRNIIARCVLVASKGEVTSTACALALVRQACLQPLGREHVLSNKYLLPLLRTRLHHSHPDVRIQAALTSHALASNWFGVQAMIQHHYTETIINVIFSCINPTPVLVYLLATLEMLIESSESARIAAIAGDCFDLAFLLEHDDARVRSAMASVLSRLFRSPVGKAATVQLALVEKLKQCLSNENTEAKVKLVAALMFATIHTPALREAAKPNLMDKMLTMLARYDIPRELQVDAVKVLTNMTSVAHLQDSLRNYLVAFTKLRHYNKSFVGRHVDTLISAALYRP